jgi:predicted RNase H-like HicB family nuclease
MKYAVIYEQTETGYSAYAPDLPGCIAAASTIQETKDLMREAIQFHLECMRDYGERIPEPTTIADEVEVRA